MLGQTQDGREHYVTTEEEIELLQPRARNLQGLLATTRSKEEVRKDSLPYRFQREHNHADTLISTSGF